MVWDVLGTDAGDFRIDSSGNLAFDGVPDYETPGDSGGDNVYEVSVDAKDADYISSLDVTVTVTPVDEPPVVTGVSTINDYYENGTVDVAAYSATDPEGDSDITWSLAGPDSGDFDITGGVSPSRTPLIKSAQPTQEATTTTRLPSRPPTPTTSVGSCTSTSLSPMWTIRPN